MKISNCKKSFSNNDFSLDVGEFKLKENKINCLIGENGSGKSTLLKLIVEDECIHDVKSKVLMLQRPYIFNGTVLYNVELIKKISVNKSIDMIQLLKDLNLYEYKNYQAKTLSGGQKQRLAFAMVLVSDYDLIMLDEPFNNIDIKSQKIMIELMKKTNKTFLLVSHKINLSKKIGDYFFLIDDGRITYEGNKDNFFNDNNHIVKELVEME